VRCQILTVPDYQWQHACSAADDHRFLVPPKLQRVHTSSTVAMGAGCSAARLDFEAAALKL